MFERSLNSVLAARLAQERRFIQVLAGPRQVGKTTSIRQVLERVKLPSHYASADDPTLRSRSWIEQQWEVARASASPTTPGILVLDEIQKVPHWSEVVKRLWDEDTRSRADVRVVLLGSSPLLMHAVLAESLAGRFELLRAAHWSYAECREAFGWDIDTFVFFGGYPGAAPLIGEPERWQSYIVDSLIETTLSRDILLMTRVDKPALLRRLFHLACEYSGQIFSYQKMLGQLQDAGNTTTLAHYLSLLSGAGLATGLSKFSGKAIRRRGSSPKLQALNTGLISAQDFRSFDEARTDREYWGRLVESAVGAHLANTSSAGQFELYYWRQGIREVDFVMRGRGKLLAIEVKSGRRRDSIPGMDAFNRTHGQTRMLLLGADGIPLEEFLSTSGDSWLAER